MSDLNYQTVMLSIIGGGIFFMLLFISLGINDIADRCVP